MADLIKVGVLGAGAMGSGIAQVAAQNGHDVVLVDVSEVVLSSSRHQLEKIMARLVEKGRISEAEARAVQGRIHYETEMHVFEDCGLVIEAIVESLDIKKKVFTTLDETVPEDCILASNTSSLSITSIASAVEDAGRVLGIHFFNPAPLMPLVEIIPAVQTNEAVIDQARSIINSWGKVTVLAKDTPGFIVNRVARPYYGESIRVFEEGMADFATIDWALRELGGFRMGPFELMDLIGNDVNYAVTESVFAAFYYDQRYRPSFTQKRRVEAGWLGLKSGRGYYDYSEGAEKTEPVQDPELGKEILDRVLAMLINEAVDAVFLNIASPEDVDLAMTKGVNYPKGLIAWAEEIGYKTVYKRLKKLYRRYGEDRYRPSPLLRELAKEDGRLLS